MADRDVATLFQHKATQLAGLSTVIGALGISQIVHPFEGDSKIFKDWVRSIEKYASLTGLTDDRVQIMAYQSCGGGEAVSDFIQRYLRDNVGNNWGQLKTELTSRFAKISDPQYAFVLLRKIKQRPEENVQLYAERLLSLAEEAFKGQNGGVAAIERQLVGFFVDGLVHDYLKMRVMRKKSATLQAAVAFAMTEQNLRKRFNLRIGWVTDSNVCHIEPMEIDHLWPTKHCFKCNKLEHCARDCHKRPDANIEPMEFDYARSPKHGMQSIRTFGQSLFKQLHPFIQMGVLEGKNHIHETATFLITGVRQMRSKTYITCWNCRGKGTLPK